MLSTQTKIHVHSFHPLHITSFDAYKLEQAKRILRQTQKMRRISNAPYILQKRTQTAANMPVRGL